MSPLSREAQAAASLGAIAVTTSDARDEMVLYTRHFDQVLRWARRLGGPVIDPEDVAHDVFEVAFRRWASFRRDAKVSTWLFRITERVVKSHRRRDRWRTWLGGLLREDDSVAGPDPRPGPPDDLERRQSAAALYGALDRLDEAHRTTFILSVIDELPAEEVAALQDITPATVWVRVHRARKRIVEHLERKSGGRAKGGG